jgi:hypothetical protein
MDDLRKRRRAIVEQQKALESVKAAAIEKVEAWFEKKHDALDEEWQRLMRMSDQLDAEAASQREAEEIAEAGRAVAHA